MAQFFSVPATDSHVHITAPEDLAYMKDYCSRFGFDGVNVACINHEVLDASSNILAAILKLEDSRFMAHAGLLYPCFPVVTPVPAEFDFLAQAKEFTAIGFDDCSSPVPHTSSAMPISG